MRLITRSILCSTLVGVCACAAQDTADQPEDVSYGLDVSFPIHSSTVQMENNPLGDRHQAYLDHLEGCRRMYPHGQCDVYEEQRLLMNRRQPLSMKVRLEG